MGFLNFIHELSSDKLTVGQFDYQDNDTIYIIEEGFFNIDYVFIKENSIELSLSNELFKITYDEIANVTFGKENDLGLRILLNKKQFVTIKNMEYAKILKKVINTAKKYKTIDAEDELKRVASDLGLNLNNLKPENITFLYCYGSRILNFIHTKNSHSKEILKGHINHITINSLEADIEAFEIILELDNDDKVLFFEYNEHICDKSMFYENAKLIANCKMNKIFDENIKIYSIIYSNSGNDGSSVSSFVKSGAEQIFDKGLFGALKDFAKNIGSKIVNEKVALMLTDKIVIIFNLDQMMYFTFSLQEATRFVYKKDDYFPNAIDIFENNVSDKALVENVSAFLYNDFYVKLTELINYATNISLPQTSKKTKLLELKELFKEGLIDEDEYRSSKQIILNN